MKKKILKLQSHDLKHWQKLGLSKKQAKKAVLENTPKYCCFYESSPKKENDDMGVLGFGINKIGKRLKQATEIFSEPREI